MHGLPIQIRHKNGGIYMAKRCKDECSVDDAVRELDFSKVPPKHNYNTTDGYVSKEVKKNLK